jgi:hypothetical protein
VDVDVDAGNVDVSVRVLSPGEDAPEAAELPLISGSPESDTTVDSSPTSGHVGEASGDDTHGSNTNVTVRVLSPGDNGPVDQNSPFDAAKLAEEIAESAAGEADATDAAGHDTAPEAADDSLTSGKEIEQYQESDSRYQSENQFADDPWTWLWYLSLDCTGNASSSSTETGVQSSNDWTWKWTWEWACNSPPHPPPLGSLEDGIDDESTRAPPEESTPTSTASAAGAAGGGDAAPAPWRWTWTFTFCGETVTATLPVNPETELQWVWDWMWTWTCQEATATEPSESPGTFSTGDPAPAASTEASGESSGGSAAGSGASTVGREVDSLLAWITGMDLPAWVLPLAPPELGIAVVPGLGPLTDSGSTSTIGDVVPIPLPFGTSAPPISAADAPVVFDTTVISPGVRRQQQRPVSAASPAASGSSLSGHPEPEAAAPRAEKASARAKRQSRSRSGGAPLSPWPPLRPFQAAGAPGASSSFVPSASVLGTAALVALFVLAAPGFGRRIRVARELRPRGTYGSSIDHPG